MTNNYGRLFRLAHLEKASTVSTAQLLVRATGKKLNPEYFKKHLVER
ncbi:hypothetical protein C942_03606 [Photobacterium marinum]|uniref:Uncharacterized protein n=1 Tax=Photobacterium marinum TaxID=1056511 RepID=L8J7M6_9GAMM|nr:hypothetical protein C942_03606 [Photobacterium marinum]